MIAYTHKVHARARNLKITIHPSGQVIVTTPRFIPKLIIDSFVNEKEAWITKQLASIPKPQKNELNQSQILFKGVEHSIVKVFDPKQPIGVHIEKNSIYINPVVATSESYINALERFLKHESAHYILHHTQVWAKKMNTSYQNVVLKNQSTRWGSCSSKGNLNFNWKLIHAPTEVIDYVIIHELAHRTHMDHSKNFWDLVGKFDPEFHKHRGWLKRHGMRIAGIPTDLEG